MTSQNRKQAMTSLNRDSLLFHSSPEIQLFVSQEESSKYSKASTSLMTSLFSFDDDVINIYSIKVKVEEIPQTCLLLMLDVPASVDAHGIIEFTSPFCDVITNIRIIRDQTPNQYMVLLEFASNQDACNYFTSLNNKPFNYERSEEICHLAFVASVKVLPQFESSLNDPKSNGSLLQLPTSNTTELPNCMVCLERMDESVRGVLTILCNHSFHAMCLQQWEDLNCPVCRYVQTPEPYTHKKCSTCGALEDLWICLICGNVGCGRYTTEHAQQHYSETYHNFAMSLADNRVWDYAGGSFVMTLLLREVMTSSTCRLFRSSIKSKR